MKGLKDKQNILDEIKKPISKNRIMSNGYDEWLNEQYEIAEIIEERKELDDGKRYTLSEVKEMFNHKSIAKDICPKCGEIVYSDGVHNGLGYIFPPFHCECGWSEMCSYEDYERCKSCDQYEKCYRG